MGWNSFPVAFLVLGAVKGEVKRDIIRSISFPGLGGENSVWAHGLVLVCGNLPRKWFPSRPLVTWVIQRGMKTDYRNQSLLGPHQAGPWPPCPCSAMLFISINKDLFHSLEDGNLNHWIILFSCQLIFSFSPFPQALKKKSRWSQGRMEGDAKEKIKLEEILLK